MEIKLVYLYIGGDSSFIKKEILEVRETPINFITESGKRMPKSRIMIPRLTTDGIESIYCSVLCYLDDEDAAVKLVKKEVGNYIKKVKAGIEKLDKLFYYDIPPLDIKHEN